MNLKNFIFCALVANAISYVRCSDMEQKSQKEQNLSNYEQVLKMFPDILDTLKSNNITEDEINNARDRLLIEKNSICFRRGKNIVYIQKTETLLKYKVTIREPVMFSHAC